MLRKGVQYLLEAWKQLAWRDAELWLVGRVMADCAPVLRHYADLPGVTLLGYVPDQVNAYQTSDVLVVPSVEDGFALVVARAMACGLPVIVSNHTGAADLVQDSESGFVVKFDAPQEYVRALESLAQIRSLDARWERPGAPLATTNVGRISRSLDWCVPQILEQEAL